MKKQQAKKLVNLLLTLILLAFLMRSPTLYAGSDSLSFSVKVTVVQKTCNLNDNKPIDVLFGDVYVIDINDENKYERSIPYMLDCEGATTDEPLKFKFSGVGASFNSQLLQTSETYLGLKLKQNGQAFALNTSIDFTYDKQPVLTVVPVKSSQGGLDDGDFSASATFTVEYQ